MPKSSNNQSGYVGISFKEGGVEISTFIAGNTSCSTYPGVQSTPQQISETLQILERDAKSKFIAASIYGATDPGMLASKLWLENDIVPFIESSENDSRVLARLAALKFGPDNIVNLDIGPHNEVNPSELVTIEDYQALSSAEEFTLLNNLAGQYKDKKLIFLSATPRGGGVALMRHAIIRLYRLLGVNAHWHVLTENLEVFDVTKRKFHNILHAVAPPGCILTEKDKLVYESWISQNALLLQSSYQDADVVVIDDPQPSGLIPYIKQANPNVKIIYRSHIHIVADLAVTPGTPQHATWNYIWNNIKDSDCFISHPIKDFIPSDVPSDKTILMPATTDPLDGLNKPLSENQIEYYIGLFNEVLAQNGQTALDPERKYIVQIARFDPSKGIPDVIESYAKLRQKLVSENKEVPQLVICGHGSVDDPDGKPLFDQTISTLQQQPHASWADDIKVVRLPHVDQILNAVLRKAHVALQLSHKEGFEVKVTESLMKGKPVIAYERGGIPLQIEDGVSGHIIKQAGDTSAVADHLYQLFTDMETYAQMSANAQILARRDVLTTANAINWLFLSTQLVNTGKMEGLGLPITSLIAQHPTLSQ